MQQQLEVIFKKNPLWGKVSSILTRCQKSGYHSVIAGGAVRDGLLGKTPKDFDIATAAHPDQILSLFPYAKTVGKSFGVVWLPIGKGQGVEVATFRKDGAYLDGRHPSSVEFCHIEEDAQRRDFTINALYYDMHENKILDFVQGLNDLKNKVIRTVGLAEKRFEEDQLRILRAVRFAIMTGFSIEDQTLHQMTQFVPQLKRISKERILDELNKTFQQGCFTETVQCLKNINFFTLLNSSWPSEYPTVWNIKNLNRPLYFWWSLLFFPAVVKDENLLRHFLESSILCFSNQSVSQIKRFFSFYAQICDEKIRLGKKLRLLDQDEGVLYMELTEHIQRLHPSSINLKSLLDLYHSKTVENKLPKSWVKGEDLIQAEIQKGPIFSTLLEKLYDDQLEGITQSRKEALMKLGQYKDQMNL